MGESLFYRGKLALARTRLEHALSLQVLLHQRRRETTIVQAQAETLIAVSTEHGFPFRAAIGSMLLGWATVERGAGQAGIARIEEGIAAFQTTGARLRSAAWLALLAEAYGKLGQIDKGLTVVVDALQAAEDTGEHFYDAELQRLKGEFLLQRSSDNQREAETCFDHALRIAHAQQAKSWELRAAASLSQLWQRQSKRAAARALLAPIYGWCTEGFDTADLQEAKMVLEEL